MTINAPVITDAASLSRWSDRTPNPANCLNCGTPRTAEYCGTCGQREIDPRPTLRELLREVAEELLGWDGKLVRTVRLLITKPGALTVEYLAGRRASIISPLRVYLACSVIAFFVSAVTPDSPPRIRRDGTAAPTAQGQILADGTLNALTSWPPNAAGSQSSMDAAIGRSVQRARADRAGFRQKVAGAVPKLLFVLAPVLAVLVGLAFRSRMSHYPGHLAFTLHVHAVVFLTLVLPQLATLAHSYRVHRWTLNAAVLIILSYFFLAARRVYGRGIFSTGVRVLVIVGLYFFLFYASLGLTSLAIAFTY